MTLITLFQKDEKKNLSEQFQPSNKTDKKCAFQGKFSKLFKTFSLI